MAKSQWRSRSVIALAATAVYVYGFPSASIPYVLIDLFHVAVGIFLAAILLPFLAGVLRASKPAARVGWVLLAAGTILGLILIFTGTTAPMKMLLYAHILVCAAGALFLAGSWMASRGWLGAGAVRYALGVTGLIAVAAGISAGAWWYRTTAWNEAFRIVNPPIAPASMDNEGDGAHGKFFPSSGQTKDGKDIPAKYFIQSDACERCHQDIYNQWYSSMHHNSSFNNQWYRKSIEYMQDSVGIRPSKWCAGCHDPALLYSGMFDRPVREIEDTPAGQAGLSCLMCHSIVHVKSTMGQGDYTLEYPRLHAIAASKNRVVRTIHDFYTYLNPEPHKRTFLKPFMREQTAQFCSACHKVHLDVPVNDYRWVRGFDEYDNWQASGISGEGSRSFYYPPSPEMCADCHMPLVRSNDAGNINGYVHSHRFPGANTAIPTANEDQTQLETSEHFLKDGQVSVDIFAVSPEGKETNAPSSNTAMQPEISTTFAVGEESEALGPIGAASGEARPITAPLDRVNAGVRRGDDVRVDVVVRTRKVGHFFPGGTIDAFDVWLELKAVDDKGQTIFWSGKVEDDGKGPVEKGAHFYKSLLIDEHGNEINKRNAFASRATMYVRLIPPGAADTAHFRLHIPENAGNKITLEAKLNYRKFMWWNTQFAYAGVVDPSAPKSELAPAFDDRKMLFTGDTTKTAGKVKYIPNLPIITMAQDTKTLSVLPRSAEAPKPQIVLEKEDWTRWNDYGIGLLLQGDLKGAEAAFGKITEMDPQNPDGWVNIGRCLAQEGDTAGAEKVLRKALEISPKLARANFFYAHELRAEGKYDEAASYLQVVLAQYPKDRVAINELGRIRFLQKRYTEAVTLFQETLEIDPEDLQANYNMMLCYNGLGNEAKADEYKVRYLRFKADEASQAITGAYRQAHPEDNNERQLIHEHVSVPLGAEKAAAVHRPYGARTSASGTSRTEMKATYSAGGGTH
ncbi:MAG TPA: tetratricopeptide repeat protein [Candidatus Acidoferrum sp.]|nr:tetratricopeptide repeat protein [Candidatus Acidoferrum sp.]